MPWKVYWLLVNFDKRFSLNTSSKDSLCWHLQLNLISFISHCLLRLEGTFLVLVLVSVFPPEISTVAVILTEVDYLIVGSISQAYSLQNIF